MNKLSIFLLAVPAVLHAQQDSSITVTVKVTAIRVVHDTVKTVRVDTLRLGSGSSATEDPRGWNCWTIAGACVDPTKPVEPQSTNTTLQSQGQTFGYHRYMRNGVVTTADPTPKPSVPASIEIGVAKAYYRPCLTYLKSQPSSVPYATGGCIPDSLATKLLQYGIIVGGYKDSTAAYIYNESQRAEFNLWFANQIWPTFPAGKVDLLGMPVP